MKSTVLSLSASMGGSLGSSSQSCVTQRGWEALQLGSKVVKWVSRGEVLL